MTRSLFLFAALGAACTNADAGGATDGATGGATDGATGIGADGPVGDGPTGSGADAQPLDGGPGDVDATPSTVASPRLALGNNHSCLLDPAGTLRCWGLGTSGQLGDGALANHASPTVVPGGPYLAVAAGSFYTCAITAARRVVCWGRGTDGQLGDGTSTDRATPTPVIGLDVDVVGLDAGGATTCAVLASGGLRCWGNNVYGQVGDGTQVARPSPVDVVGLTGPIAAVTLGSAHTCATTTAGALACWGWAYSGRLGNGENGVSQVHTAPITLTTLTGPADLPRAGNAFSCTRVGAARVSCWGENSSGQLGNGGQVPASEPILVAGVLGVNALATAFEATCAVSDRSVVRCWGRNRSGQIGNGNGGVGQVVTVPTQVMGLDGLGPTLDELASGNAHTCVRTSTERVFCWGNNTYGQVGDGSVNIDRTSAVEVLL